MAGISRVRIANRGEIAVRIIHACQKMGIESVVTVSEPDKKTLAAKIPDRSVCIGPAAPSESYLRIESIICAALGTGADAIHPGYGFLAENPRLPEACDKYMIRALLSLKGLSFNESEGKVCYQYAKQSSEQERMDYLEFIPKATSHIPDKGQVMMRYYGLYSNAQRGKMRREEVDTAHLPIIEEHHFIP